MLKPFFDQFTDLTTVTVTPSNALLLLGAGLAGVLLLLAIIMLLVSGARRRRAIARAKTFTERLEGANKALERQIGELQNRVQVMAEVGASRHGELSANLNERLDHVSERLADHLLHVSERLTDSMVETKDKLTANLAENNDRIARSLAETNARLNSVVAEAGERTSDQLSALKERLAVIDTAQASLNELSSHVLSLREVLGNKQARGAYGQMRMETIIEDALPRSAYAFQPTLSNGKRPDCVIKLPNTDTVIVVDAKFPLEGFEALRKAQSPEREKAAGRTIREAVSRHIDDISRKYILPGETHDTALMFVPSESIHATLHEGFADLVQKSYQARVMIVSPNMLMLAVQTMLAILKDVRMREQAGLIQREVGLLVADVARLGERAHDLERHFSLASKDVEKILTSTEKISGRGRRIGALDVEQPIDVKARKVLR